MDFGSGPFGSKNYKERSLFGSNNYNNNNEVLFRPNNQIMAAQPRDNKVNLTTSISSGSGLFSPDKYNRYNGGSVFELENNDPKQPPPSLSEPQPIVYITIGKNKQKFAIHKNLLCYYSSYFKDQFSTLSADAKSDEAALQDEDPQIFGFFVSWLYIQKIEEKVCLDQSITLEGRQAKKNPTYSELIQLWIFADHRGIHTLQNCITDTLSAKRHHTRLFPVQDYAMVYEKTKPAAPLRQLLTHLFCFYMDYPDRYIKENVSLFTRSMLLDIATVYAKARFGETPHMLQNTHYHVNEEGNPIFKD